VSDISKLVGGASLDVLPEQLKQLICAILEGRVMQFAVVVEFEDGTFGDCFPTLCDGANRYAMLGALEALRRDYLREHIQSRTEYLKGREE
jgi:hypothetical protein